MQHAHQTYANEIIKFTKCYEHTLYLHYTTQNAHRATCLLLNNSTIYMNITFKNSICLHLMPNYETLQNGQMPPGVRKNINASSIAFYVLCIVFCLFLLNSQNCNTFWCTAKVKCLMHLIAV